MSFVVAMRRAREVLREEGCLSRRALKREVELDYEAFSDLVEELLDVQKVAVAEGDSLVWTGNRTVAPSNEGERRQLSVLFCDVVGSTQIASRLDPEDWRDLLRDYQEAAQGVIGRFGGYVAQFLGDGVLAYFGYPQAFEDDAERAVRAGLSLVDTLEAQRDALLGRYGEELSIRVGVHTGQVVVGEVGTGEAKETLALGRTTHVAARLQSYAARNCVVMGARTARLTSGIFVTEDLGTVDLVGVSEPEHAFRAVHVAGMRSRLDVNSTNELSPFVGRRSELAMLENGFAELSQGRGCAVLISGEAGVGKSRLLQKFRASIEGKPHSWLEVRGSAHTKDSALYPVLALQRDGLGFRTRDPISVQREALRLGLARMDFDVEDTLPLLEYFHGIADANERYEDRPPEASREELFDLFSEWLARLAKRQPVVMIVEDAHWLDPSTLEAMAHMMERLERSPILLIATCRADLEPAGASHDMLQRMDLVRLDNNEVRELIRKVAGGRTLSERWVDEILDRADGVPLFVEELVLSALDSSRRGDDGRSDCDVEIPDTLHDLFEARLDALGPTKELAQLASVLGREFSYDLILKVSAMEEDELLEALDRAVRAGLFYRRGNPPEATYLFKHALLRDAAYQSLVRPQRKRHHLHVAQTILARMPQVAEARPELVGHHLAEAEEFALASEYWRRSGEFYNARSAHREALTQLRRGLTALSHTGPEADRDARELSIQIALGVSLQAVEGFSSPSLRVAYDRAQELCERVRDPSLRASGLWGSVVYCVTTGQLVRARTLAEQLEAIGTDATPTTAAAYALGNVAFLEGRFQDACLHNECALSRNDPDDSGTQIERWGHDFQAVTHAYSSWALWPLGRFREAKRQADLAVARARSVSDPVSLAFCLVFAAAIAKMLRDRDGTRRLADEAAALSKRHGFPLYLGAATILQGWCESDPSRALQITRHGVETAAGTQNQTAAPHILGILADVSHRAGQCEEAVGAIDLALGVASQLGMHFWDAELHGRRGEFLIELGRPDDARRALTESLSIAREQGALGLAMRALLRRLRAPMGGFDRERDLADLAVCLREIEGGTEFADVREARAER